MLEGVPNTAFTEALAMVLQGHDLEVLGLATPDPQTERLKTLNDFWNTYEISGVAMVDMDVWHWMYDHPNATPEQLRDATIRNREKRLEQILRAGIRQKRRRTSRGIFPHD